MKCKATTYPVDGNLEECKCTLEKGHTEFHLCQHGFRFGEAGQVGVSFTVVGPPIPKARARVFQTSEGSRGRTPKKTKDYEKHVAMLALAARQKLSKWPLDHKGGYAVDIQVTVKSCTCDLDNIGKSILDAMNKIIYRDDKLVDDLRIKRKSSPTVKEAVFVTVTLLE